MAGYQCKKCGREFAQRKYLQQHKNRKVPCGDDLQCKKCFHIFSDVWSLARHKKRKTPCAPEEVPVIQEDNPDNRCQFCNNTYASKSNLKRHQKTCDKDKNMQVIMDLMVKKMDTMAEQNKLLVEKVDNMSKQLIIPDQTTINNDNRQLNIQFVNFPIQDMSTIDMKEILRIVDALQTDELCPCNRAVGGDTIDVADEAGKIAAE